MSDTAEYPNSQILAQGMKGFRNVRGISLIKKKAVLHRSKICEEKNHERLEFPLDSNLNWPSAADAAFKCSF